MLAVVFLVNALYQIEEVSLFFKLVGFYHEYVLEILTLKQIIVLENGRKSQAG